MGAEEAIFKLGNIHVLVIPQPRSDDQATTRSHSCSTPAPPPHLPPPRRRSSCPFSWISKQLPWSSVLVILLKSAEAPLNLLWLWSHKNYFLSSSAQVGWDSSMWYWLNAYYWKLGDRQSRTILDADQVSILCFKILTSLIYILPFSLLLFTCLFPFSNSPSLLFLYFHSHPPSSHLFSSSPLDQKCFNTLKFPNRRGNFEPAIPEVPAN